MYKFPDRNSWKKVLVFSKQKAIAFSLILFFTYRFVYLISHSGFFSFDEFYHIATLNPDYSTSYNRADYINNMVKAVCFLFGEQDFTVKLIPLILGTISFLSALYLMYHLYENPYWILTISCILTILPLIANNHFYIRMYVFLEALVMVDCVLFYLADHTKNRIDRIAYLFLAELLAFAYFRNTSDFSAKAVLLLVSCAVLYDLGRDVMLKLFKGHQWLKFVAVISGLCMCISAGYIVAYKQQWIKGSFFENEKIADILGMNLLTFYYSDSPVFLKYMYIKLFFVLIPFVFSAIYVWKKNIQDKKTLFVMTALPLLGYSIVLFNNNLMRTYVAFLPILCVLSLVFFDRFRLSRTQHLTIIMLVIILSAGTQKNFWENPSIKGETSSEGLGYAVELARTYEKEGYELVPMMAYETQSAYFDMLNADISLNLENIRQIKENRDENGKQRGNDAIFPIIQEQLKYILDSSEKRVLVMNSTAKYIFQGLEKEYLDKDNYEVINSRGGTRVIVIN